MLVLGLTIWVRPGGLVRNPYKKTWNGLKCWTHWLAKARPHRSLFCAG